MQRQQFNQHRHLLKTHRIEVGQRLTTAIKEQAIGLLTESLASKNIIAIINFETKIINNTAQIEITIEELSKAKITKLTILGLKNSLNRV